MDVLIRYVINDDTENVRMIINSNNWNPPTPYSANNFRDAALCLKSIAMYNLLQAAVPFTRQTNKNIIQYTKSIDIVKYIIKIAKEESKTEEIPEEILYIDDDIEKDITKRSSKESPKRSSKESPKRSSKESPKRSSKRAIPVNKFIPHIDMFKNTSLDIIKFLIEETKWTDFNLIYTVNQSPQVLHYLMKDHVKNPKYNLNTRMKQIKAYNDNICTWLFSYGDCDFIGAVLNGCQIHWESGYLALPGFKMLLALGINPFDALYRVENFEINCYLAEHHIYPTRDIMNNGDASTFNSAVISLRLNPDLSNLVDLCADYGDDVLAKYLNFIEHKVLLDARDPEGLEHLFNIADISKNYIVAAIINNPDIHIVELIIYLYKKKTKSIKFIQEALRRAPTVEKLKLLLSFDFSLWDELLKCHDNVELLRYLHLEYDYDKKDYNDALDNASSFDKIRFLIEECGADDYNNALLNICNQSTINFENVEYLVNLGANNFNDMLFIMCKNSRTLKAFDEKLVLYFYNLGATNINKVLVMLMSYYSLKELRLSSVFSIIVSLSDNCNKVIPNKQQLYYLNNGMGIFLYKNPQLLFYTQAIPYIEYRSALIKILDKYFIYGLSGLVAEYYGHVSM